MDEQHSIAEARSRLPELVREAEAGKAVEITRRGEGVAVSIGREQYERLVARSRRFSEACEDFASEVDLAELDIDPEEVFASVRDTTPGRVREVSAEYETSLKGH
ncbi:MAG: type II toxin-antitoxin system prevent-host-death family antitoxin [Thermoanaerobaculia bacterium]